MVIPDLTYEEVIDVLRRLPIREQIIIDLRFGITRKKCTLKKIGIMLNISIERVRQIEKKSLIKLRWMMSGSRFIQGNKTKYGPFKKRK